MESGSWNFTEGQCLPLSMEEGGQERWWEDRWAIADVMQGHTWLRQEETSIKKIGEWLGQ